MCVSVCERLCGHWTALLCTCDVADGVVEMRPHGAHQPPLPGPDVGEPGLVGGGRLQGPVRVLRRQNKPQRAKKETE